MRLIGITGVARSGKDTVGDYLNGIHDYKPYAFAEPIRRAAAAMFGLPLAHFQGDNDKREEPDPFWGISPREMLQKIGTEGGRDVFGQDLWIKRAWREWSKWKSAEGAGISHMSGLVITDVRFDNEAQWIIQEDGIIIRVVRPGVEAVNSHVSEAGVSDEYITHDVVNDGTIEELYAKVQEILNSL